MNLFPRICCLAVMASLCAACSLAPEVVKPQLSMPSEWPSKLIEKTNAGQSEELSIKWWKRFGDPVLDALIDEAFAHNRDLSAALSRIQSAKAKLNVSRADLLPRIDGKAQASPMYYDGKRAVELPYGASFAASWEIDLWGKYRNLAEAQKAEYLSTEAAYEGVKLALAGQVATSYFTVQMLERKKHHFSLFQHHQLIEHNF